MSTKIVVGVDGSEPSARAVEWCAKYAEGLGAEVVAVHVIEIPVYAAPMLPLPTLTAEGREEIRDLTAREWCAALTKANVPHRVLLLDGTPAEALMRAADAEKADLVVTGTRGRGGFAELLLGSTSHSLSHHLDRPLLIVP